MEFNPPKSFDFAVSIVLLDVEEKDQLRRSNKNIKVGASDDDTIMNERNRMKDVLPPDNTNQRHKVSFKDVKVTITIPFK